MSNYIQNIIMRYKGESNVVKPRINGIFENQVNFPSNRSIIKNETNINEYANNNSLDGWQHKYSNSKISNDNFIDEKKKDIINQKDEINQKENDKSQLTEKKYINEQSLKKNIDLPSVNNDKKLKLKRESHKDKKIDVKQEKEIEFNNYVTEEIQEPFNASSEHQFKNSDKSFIINGSNIKINTDSDILRKKTDDNLIPKTISKSDLKEKDRVKKISNSDLSAEKKVFPSSVHQIKIPEKNKTFLKIRRPFKKKENYLNETNKNQGIHSQDNSVTDSDQNFKKTEISTLDLSSDLSDINPLKIPKKKVNTGDHQIIRINIGRIEIKAVSSEKQIVNKPAKEYHPKISLSDYLENSK